MSRKTKVVGFSLPPEIYQKLEQVIKTKHKTRSEFFREIIDAYFETVKDQTSQKVDAINIGETDLAKVLKSYWLLRSKTKLEVITIGLAIIVNDQDKVLIGARKNKDLWVENLTWVFPGGNLKSLNFEQEIKKTVKRETGLSIDVNCLVASRTYPDSGFKPVNIVGLYFYCTLGKNQSAKPGGDLSQLKWVQPIEVFKYFTTSTCDEVTKFLTTIEKGTKINQT